MKIFRYLDQAGTMGFGRFDEQGQTFLILKKDDGDFEATDQRITPFRLLTPIDFRCIYAVGLNYKAHAEESGQEPPKYPMIFMKAPTSIQNPGDPIVLPRFLRSDRVDYEGELGVVIGRPCKNVKPEDALTYVLGYTCANDVSARDWQKDKGGGQFCRGKSFDTFCPSGPCLVTADEIPDPSKLTIRTFVNEDKMQESSTDDLISTIQMSPRAFIATRSARRPDGKVSSLMHEKPNDLKNLEVPRAIASAVSDWRRSGGKLGSIWRNGECMIPASVAEKQSPLSLKSVRAPTQFGPRAVAKHGNHRFRWERTWFQPLEGEMDSRITDKFKFGGYGLALAVLTLPITATLSQAVAKPAVEVAFVELKARGGGDWPESVNEALDVAVNTLQWSKGSDAKHRVSGWPSARPWSVRARCSPRLCARRRRPDDAA